MTELDPAGSGGEETAIVPHASVVRAVYAIVEAVSAAILAAYVLILFTQVVLRYAFNSSIFWSEEAVRYGLVWNVMLGAALITLRSGHIRIDILENLLPVRARHYLTTAIHLVSLLFLGLLFYYSVLFLQRTATQLSPAIGMPMGFAYGAICIGAGLMLFFLVAALRGHLRGAGNHRQ